MNNHDRQRLDSSLVYTGAHNVYYVKSCLSDAKCFSGSRYSFRVQELKRTDQAGMSPLRYQKWLRLNEVRRPMLNEHYDVTTAAYAVGYESYPISVGNIRGCLESHPREILPG